MSVKVTNWVWHDKATEHLRGNAVVVMLALADIADDEGHVVYARSGSRSQVALALKARVSVATFRRVTQQLAEEGLLSIERESQRAENEYRIEMTAQSERSQVSGHTAQVERSDRSPSERSSTSTPSYRRSNEVDVNEGPRKRGSRIPDPFVLTAEMKAWAAAEVPGLDVVAHTKEFVDHWRSESGAKASKLDWVGAWRNWMRKAHRWSKPSGQRPQPMDRLRETFDLGQELQAELDAGRVTA